MKLRAQRGRWTPGSWVMHGSHVAVVAAVHEDRPDGKNYELHYVDEHGETMGTMIHRTHTSPDGTKTVDIEQVVAAPVFAGLDELRPAQLDDLPVSRRPQAPEKG